MSAALEKERVDYGRPGDLENDPCAAVFWVGSWPVKDVGTCLSFLDLLINEAEGGVIGVPQFPQVVRDEKVLTYDNDKDMYRLKPVRADDMNHQVIVGKVPSLVATTKGVMVAGLKIEEDGRLNWGRRKARHRSADCRNEWERVSLEVMEDFNKLMGLGDGGFPDELYEGYEIDERALPGLKMLLGKMDDLKEKGVWAIKLQLASPDTILNSITDREGVKLSQSEEIKSHVQMVTAIRNRWLIEAVRRSGWEGKIMLSVDAPGAGSIGESNEAGVQSDMEMASCLVQDMDGVEILVHSCSSLPSDKPGLITESVLDGVHVDIFGDEVQILNKELAEWLMEGDHRIALGIVPTHQFTLLAEEVEKRVVYGQAKAEGVEMSEVDAVALVEKYYSVALRALEERLERIVDRLYEYGNLEQAEVTKRELWQKLMISSACGFGSRSEEVTNIGRRLMRDLSVKIRRSII